MERTTRIEKLSKKRAREKKKLFRIGGTSLAIITTFTGYGSSNFLSGDRAEAASVQLQENIQGKTPNVNSKKVVKLPDHEMTISTCNQIIQTPVKKAVTSPKQEEQTPAKEAVTSPKQEEQTPVKKAVTSPKQEEQTPVKKAVTSPKQEEQTPVKKAVTSPKQEEQTPVKEAVTSTHRNGLSSQKSEISVDTSVKRDTPSEQKRVLETLGVVTGLVDSNDIELNIEGETKVFNTEGDRDLQNEISRYKEGTTLVIRYTVSSQGKNKINDIVKVSDPLKGDESISIEADYFEMINSHMIRVYVNHQLTTFKLSNYLEERHLNFGAGTKVLLTGVKTTDGTTIENISPL